MDNYGNELYHHGILGQKWGVRRYQNYDGTYTKAGMARYNDAVASGNRKDIKAAKKNLKNSYAYDKQVKKYGGEFKYGAAKLDDQAVSAASGIGALIGSALWNKGANELIESMGSGETTSNTAAAYMLAAAATQGVSLFLNEKTHNNSQTYIKGADKEMTETLKKYDPEAYNKSQEKYNKNKTKNDNLKRRYTDTKFTSAMRKATVGLGAASVAGQALAGIGSSDAGQRAIGKMISGTISGAKKASDAYKTNIRDKVKVTDAKEGSGAEKIYTTSDDWINNGANDEKYASVREKYKKMTKKSIVDDRYE